MDFSHSTTAATAGLPSSALGFSERSLSSLASDLTDNYHRGRMSNHHNMPLTSVGSMSPGLNPLKQCRSEMDMDGRGDDRRGPPKFARTDSFTCRQADFKMHMSTNSPGASQVRSNALSDGRLGCSPTNSCASDGGLLGSDATVASDSRQLIHSSDSGVSAPPYPGSQQQGRSALSYHHQTYRYKPAGSPLSMGREAGGYMSIQNTNGARAPFTSGQWAELEHQALIFKYMMAGVNVPPELLNPVRKSVAAMNGLSVAPHHANNMGWGSFHLGVASNADPEPGRCRRTDGKKWRCSRDVVPDQKYCERHMHRGRHRARKPTDGQSTTTSPAATASLSAATSPTVSTSRGSGIPGSAGGSVNSGLTHNSLSPTMSPSSHQHPNLGLKSFGSAHFNGGSGGMSVGSPGGSNSTASQFLFPLQSTPGASALSNKDYRYLNGMTNVKTELGMVPEQLPFSERSGNTRGIGGPDSPSMSNLSRLSSVNHSWQALASKVPQAPSPKLSTGNGSSSVLQYSSPQMKSLLGQDFGLIPDSDPMNMSMAQQQAQSFLSIGGYGSEAVSVVREQEGQPLRHFFDDWPSGRDPTSLYWPDVEEDRSNRSNASTTQLSISIPVTSSDFPNSNSSPSRGKLSLSPLKLSMSRAGEGDSEQLGSTDPTHMGLGVGEGTDNEERNKQTTWIPISWENPGGGLGGPLAEVLQSSIPTMGSGGNNNNAAKSSGLNLLCDGWDNSPRNNPRMSSPTGVLQKANFASSFSDNSSASSSGSSPRIVVGKSEIITATTAAAVCEQK